jgi:hypothetical protein
MRRQGQRTCDEICESREVSNKRVFAQDRETNYPREHLIRRYVCFIWNVAISRSVHSTALADFMFAQRVMSCHRNTITSE